MNFEASWVAEVTGGTVGPMAASAASGVVKDSRDATAGSMYVALIGERLDGHAFVADAAAAGAAFHLVSEPVAYPHVLVDDTSVALADLARAHLRRLRADGDITVVGITGSVGKTTTKDLLRFLLEDALIPVGSYNNHIGLPITVLRADADTRYLVLEMGANGRGHIEFLTRIAPPDIAVVLAVGQAHLGEYEGIDDVAAAKAEIVAGAADGATAILNSDDPRVAAMAANAEKVVTFGMGAADVRATDVRTERGCARFDIHTDNDRVSVALNLVGEHHVYNALAAATVARQCGRTLEEIASGLAEARPLSAHRMALSERSDGVRILDDSYNASPESMKAAMRALVDVADGGRSVAVIGEMLEMGAHSIAAHDELGHLAVRLGIDRLTVVGPGAKPAYEAAVREGSWGDEATYVATIEEARAQLDTLLARGDTVLVKASHGSGLWRLADELVGE